MSKPKPSRIDALLGLWHLEPDQRVGALGSEANDRTLGKPRVDVRACRHSRPGEIDEQAAREDRRGLGEVRVDALLPAIRAGGAQAEALRGSEDAERLEVRGFQQHLGRVLRDLALLASHDRRQSDGLLTVGDHEIVRSEPPQRSVERPQLLVGTCAPNDDPPARELPAIERVQRAPPDVHDVVRDVDDVGDRAHLGEVEARTEPLRRGSDGDVVEDAADVARAAGEVLDRDVDALFVDDGRIRSLGNVQLSVEQRRDLARQSDHGEQIDPIRRRCDVEDSVPDRQHVDERRSRLDSAREHDDAGVIRPEADLVLGQDHPSRGLAAKLALVERAVEDREQRARKGNCHVRAGLEVPGAADDLSRIALSDVDLADAQPVGVRMRPDIQHRSDEETAEIAVDVRDADVANLLHVVERRDREPFGDLLRRGVDGDVLAEPGERCAHQNCPRNRGSFRQSSRRSGIPWRSTAMRSRPQPNAKPV